MCFPSLKSSKITYNVFLWVYWFTIDSYWTIRLFVRGKVRGRHGSIYLFISKLCQSDFTNSWIIYIRLNSGISFPLNLIVMLKINKPLAIILLRLRKIFIWRLVIIFTVDFATGLQLVLSDRVDARG